MAEENLGYKSVVDRHYTPSSVEVDRILSQDSLEPVDILAMLGGPGLVGKALTGVSLMAQAGTAQAGLADAAYRLAGWGLEDRAKQMVKLSANKNIKKVEADDMFGEGKVRRGVEKVFPGRTNKEVDTIVNNAVKHIVSSDLLRKQPAAMRQTSLFEDELLPLLASLTSTRK